MKYMLLYDVDYARLEFHPNFFVSIQGNKPKTVPKGKVDDFVISYSCNFLVDGNIRIIH